MSLSQNLEMKRERSPQQVAGIVASTYTFTVIAALLGALQSLKQDGFDGLNYLPQMLLALPWLFFIPIILPPIEDNVTIAYLLAGLGFLNTGMVFWIVNRYIKKRRTLP